jgi:hypothetical protein
MESESGYIHSPRTIKKDIRHEVIRNIFKTDEEVTSHSDSLITLYEQ